MEKSFGPLFTAFDESGKRSDFHSKSLSKLEVVKLYQDLYSEYLKLYYELRDTKKSLSEAKESIIEAEENGKAPFRSLFESSLFSEMLSDFIDSRIKEKLSFDEEFVHYGGHYISLNYDKTQLGDSVCLENFED